MTKNLASHFQPLKDLFKAADKNKDGEISYVEHEDFIAMQANKGRERFAELDADGNNSVSKKEARDFAIEKLKKMQKKRENMMDERIRKLEGWDGKKRETRGARAYEERKVARFSCI